MKNFQNKAKIVRVSAIIRSILFVGLVFWIILIPRLLFLNFSHPIVVPAAAFLQCGTPVFCFIVNLKLFRFFGRLKDGYLFDAQTVAYLDAAGKWWLALWLFEILFFQIGHKIFQVANAWDISGLFTSLVFIFVAWLLKEAQELQEEQELTV